MANRRKDHLDAVEQRLTGPKRIALFGHRNVGKTTLLAIFYRQASAGLVPGVRLAAADPSTAEYLADKIIQIESGESLAGTLAETELRLRLYHGPARFDLIVKDYQGEHVTLGSDEPIQQFFADCDAVFLCLDPEGSTHPADRRRRQQEVENLLEKYIEKSADGMTDRPIALLLTKFDRVMAQAGGSLDGVEKLVDARYGMTRHALSRHAKRGAIFAVSAYGHGAVDNRPPAELHPIGLEGPLAWLAEQLEAIDRDQLDWLWDLAPKDVARLSRGVEAYERRYPNTESAAAFRRKLAGARRKRARGVLTRFALAVGAIVGGLAGYDAWSYQDAVAFEREHPAVAVERRWSELLAWHPSLPLFWPERAEFAQSRQAEWKLKAEQDRIAAGQVNPELDSQLTAMKTERPTLVNAIQKVEEKAEVARQEKRWREIQAEAAASVDQPEKVLDAVRTYLRDFPDSSRKREAEALFQTSKAKIQERQSAIERRMVDDLIRAAELPNADLTALIEQARQFLNDYPESVYRPEVEKLVSRFSHTADERDIEQARQYSRQFPQQYQARIDRYQAYLKGHASGGHYIREATEAKERILREWDSDTYRLAYEHSQAHSDDVSQVAARLRDYLQLHPSGHYASAAKEYLAWWDRVSVPSEYHVTLMRGEFDPSIGKYLAGGGPDLSVTIEVAGKTYGPSPVIPNEYRPIWRYTFSKPIVWKLNDPVTIKVVDHDWSDTIVVHLSSAKDDPLAMRLLSGIVKPSKGGPTLLLFSSDFKIPELPRPE
jgi:GTPase SAR1 family protein